MSSGAEVGPTKLGYNQSVDVFGKLPIVAGSAVFVGRISAVLDCVERTVCAPCMM